jgi:hypothetical protein
MVFNKTEYVINSEIYKQAELKTVLLVLRSNKFKI